MPKKSDELQVYLKKLIHDCLPGNTVDCVIFGYQHNALHILLVQWKHVHVYSLPGGFIHKEEDIDQAAQRVLLERTGLDSVFLKQFYTFGKNNRYETNNKEQLDKKEQLVKALFGEEQALPDLIAKRVVSTGYFAMVDIEKTNVKPDLLSEKCLWIPIQKMPMLFMDHTEMVDKALEHLRIQLNYLPVGLSLLPEKFTMIDLQKLYEAILQKPQERSNFQRKILKLDVLIRHEKRMTGASNKAPYLYSFDKKKYALLLKKGIKFSA